MHYYISPPAAVLSFSGEDHQDFLQGQGTADLRGRQRFCRYSLWLDFKGNILGDGHVLKLSESEMFLISDQSTADSLIRKFDRHIIADDVTITDKSAEFDLISISPDLVNDVIRSTGWLVPELGMYQTHAQVTLFHGRRLGIDTLQALVPVNSFGESNLVRMSHEDAEALRIHASVPSIPADMDDKSLNPLEANILSALSFDKGCYLGQEVVARVHRLGRVSRRLVKFVSDDFSVHPGGFLHNQGREVGKITSVVKNCDNFVAIGWLKSRIPDGRTVCDEGVISVNSLPQS